MKQEYIFSIKLPPRSLNIFHLIPFIILIILRPVIFGNSDLGYIIICLSLLILLGISFKNTFKYNKIAKTIIIEDDLMIIVFLSSFKDKLIIPKSNLTFVKNKKTISLKVKNKNQVLIYPKNEEDNALNKKLEEQIKTPN